jgi:hypothetical protein
MLAGTPDTNQPKNYRRPQKLKYFAINAFLLFNILAISCWALPLNNPLVSSFRKLVRPYFIWSGLFQSWDMFSPDPKRVNSYLEAIVIYEDGSSELWSFPRMELLSSNERYAKERYRKFEENLQNDQYSGLWPDAARYIARLNNQKTSPPKTIMLVVRWSEIIPRTDDKYDRGQWNSNIFFTYDVQPEDLK